jgi:hypothetical protein
MKNDQLRTRSCEEKVAFSDIYGQKHVFLDKGTHMFEKYEPQKTRN